MKHYSVARAVLRRAMERLPSRAKVELDPRRVPDPWALAPAERDQFETERFRPALVELLDQVATIGSNLNLRGAFWRDLMRAAEVLRLPDRLKRYRAHFDEAVRRVGTTDFDDDAR